LGVLLIHSSAPVRLQEHLVVHGPVLHRDMPPNEIVESGLALRGNREANHVRLTAFGPFAGLAGVEAAAAAVVAEVPFGAALRLAQGGQALLRAETAVGRALLDQFLGGAPVAFQPLRLAVRRAGAADIGALVPLEADPAEGPENGRLELRPRSRPICVLDPQDEPAPPRPGEGLVEEPDVGVSHVRLARGAGREAGADLSFLAHPLHLAAADRS